MDDGWQNMTRGRDGKQQANATRFPSGLKVLADEVHEMGLKFGLYSDAGIFGCSFQPSSLGYEELDAQKYADWADMDMLEVGVNRNLTLYQDQTHQGFWAALKNPLIIGADITTIRKSSLDVLLKKEIIGINQDDLGVAASYVPELSTEDEVQVWAGPVKYKKYTHVVLALNYNKVN
ncbi:hypothetical protein ACHAQH_005277 [Verticillium albo-atrum]